MAPGRRGRRKLGLTRMDAAVQALNQMGFDSRTIRRKVKELLKEYGGDEGWIFIEDCAYKVLIDSLLDEQNVNSALPLLTDAASGNEVGEPSSLNQSQELSNALSASEADFNEPVMSPSSPQMQEKQMAIVSVSEEKDAAVSSLKTRNSTPLLTNQVSIDTQIQMGTAVSSDAAVNMDEDGDFVPDQIKNMLPTSHDQKLVVQGGGSTEYPDLSNGSDLVLPPPTWQTIRLADSEANKSLSRCKRKPCYGWLGSDENDYVLLPPMEVPHRAPCQRLPKWDVKC